MGPRHGIMGDESYGTDLPTTQINDIEAEKQLNELRKMAKFSKTKEFARLKEHIQSKIDLYQNNLPTAGGVELSNEQLGERWKIASAVIAELKEIIYAYEKASELVKNAQ